MDFHQFSCRSDNFGVLVHSPETGETASIDAPDAGAVRAALSQRGWKLSHIIVTHHHMDHVEGIGELKAETGCTVIGPANPAIPAVDRTVGDGDRFEFAGENIEVIATPGHTLDMLNYHFTDSGVVFTGDTLFALGCGRVFEGSAEQMWNSLQKLAALPSETKIYCGHEYTLANGRFALTVDGENPKLQARMKKIEKLRSDGEPTLPTEMAIELETNPFLRAADPQIRKNLGMESASDAEVFAEIRKRKDNV